MAPELLGVHLPFEEWTSRCHPEDVEEAVRSLEQAVAELKPLDITFRIVVPSGTKYIHAAAISQIRYFRQSYRDNRYQSRYHQAKRTGKKPSTKEFRINQYG